MPGGRLLKIYVYIMAGFMLLPILMTFPVAVTSTSYMTFPPKGFTLMWFVKAFQDRVILACFWRSLTLAILAGILSIIIGLLVSFGVERGNFKGKNLIETFFSGPQMIPQIIFVVALLIYYEKIGLAETFLGLLISHIVICLPFTFRTLLVSVTALDKRLEWSAEILGANIYQIFLRIILPQIKTGMIASFIFTFVLSFNNVTMALFLTGGRRTTLPVEMFNRLYIGGMTPSIPAISFVLSILGVLLFFIADRTVGVYKYLGGARGE